jgi:hypothetical protein
MGQGLTRGQAQKQASRIDACPALAPKTQEGCTELVETIMRHCQNEEHAKLVITRLLDGVSRVQVLTAEIAAIAHATRKREPLPLGCKVCNGAPWIFEPDGAKRCGCARGQALLRMRGEE